MFKKLSKVNPEILVNIVLNLITMLIGIILMSYPAFGLLNPLYYISLVFYIFSFFTVIAYFLQRKNENYELLFLSLINILTATFMYLYQNKTAAFMFGTSLLIFVLLNILNKGIYSLKFKSEKNYKWFFKLLEVTLIGVVGIFTIVNLYNEVSVITMMFGYFFVTYGIINMIEPLFELGIETKYFKKLLNEITKEKSK